MDIKEFAEITYANAEGASQVSGLDINQELAREILMLMEANGEVNVPELCNFHKTRTRLTAYDYNIEAESLDLFYFIKSDNVAGKVNNAKLQQGFNYLHSFYNEASNGTLIKNGNIEVTDELAEIVELIVNAKSDIGKLRLYILTDGLTDPNGVPESIELGNGELTVEFNVWDIHRAYQQFKICKGKEPIIVDFEIDYGTQLQCLKIKDQNAYVDVYLAMIPGKVLADVYNKYQQGLLEKNVRTFLQFKGKVNKGIRSTLREEPDMFISYNNGISTTATAIETKTLEGGDEYITKIYDWQIVNGGQTTASIAASVKDKSVDLSKVYVQVKVSIIRDEEKRDERITKISTTANSQTTIKASDFSANEPYLVEMENMSRTQWVPNGNHKPVHKWYFERTRGQYMDQLAQLTGANDRNFRMEYPKHLKILKTDIAKFVKSWTQFPYVVCKGAEENYKSFVSEIKKNCPNVTPRYYQHTIAKGVLFKVIDQIVKSKALGGYKANMNAYLMASVSYLSDRDLDFDYIWEHQDVQPEVKELIEELIPVVWEHITSLNSGGGLQMKNVGEWTKKPTCWTQLQRKLDDFNKLPEELRKKAGNGDGSPLNEAQQNLLDTTSSYSPDFWFGLAKWAKSNNCLTPTERRAAFTFGTMSSRNQRMKTIKQAKFAQSIIDNALSLGYEN